VSSNILVVGSVALDSVKTTEGSCTEALGGSAVYFSLAAALFGDVALVGVAGDDFPAAHRAMLKSRGVELSGLETAKGQTFRWEGQYGKDASIAQTLATKLNVFKDFKPKLDEAHRKAPFLFLGNIDPDLQLDVLSQMRAPKLVACDTMNFWIGSKPATVKKLLSKVDMFFCNDAEAMSLTDAPNPLQAAEAISGWGPKVVVVKKGEHGSILRYGGHFYMFPAFPLARIKDPTGAGDSFAGGFLGSLASCGGRWDELSHLKRAMLYGTVMASFNVEDFSTRRIERLTREELDARFHDLVERLAVSAIVPA
jgi:sugar/nucleoside kinase (ribokinase family)